MKLKIRRSQKTLPSGGVTFVLDILAELSPREAELVRKYGLQKQVVSDAVQLDETSGVKPVGLALLGMMMFGRRKKRALVLNDLVNGKHISCKDLGELIAAEEQLRVACANLTRYLAIAATFNGSEEVVTIAA